jgi:dynamin GTPase
MEAIDELSQLSDSMRQAASLLADEDPDETSSSRRPATSLNVVALGNVVGFLSLFLFLRCDCIWRLL